MSSNDYTYEQIWFHTLGLDSRDEWIDRMLKWLIKTAQEQITFLNYLGFFVGAAPERMEQLRRPLISTLKNEPYAWLLSGYFDFWRAGGTVIFGNESPFNECAESLIPLLDELGRGFNYIQKVKKNFGRVKGTIEECYKTIKRNRAEIQRLTEEINDLINTLNNPKNAARAIEKIKWNDEERLKKERDWSKPTNNTSSYTLCYFSSMCHE